MAFPGPALPAGVRGAGLKRDTQMGALLFGGGDDLPNPRKRQQPQLPQNNVEKHGDANSSHHEGNKLPTVSEYVLEFPKPLPWAKHPIPAAYPMRQSELPHSQREHNVTDADPGEYDAAAAVRGLAMHSQLLDQVHRCSAELRQLRELHNATERAHDGRLLEVERGIDSTKDEGATLREQVRAMDGEFRNLVAEAANGTIQTLQHHSAQLEAELREALERYRTIAEERHSSSRQRDAQLQSDLQRLSRTVQELASQCATSSNELRARIGVNEAAVQSAISAGVGITAPSAVNDAVSEHLRQQLVLVRRQASQLNAALVEVQARLDGEMAARKSLQLDHDSRISGLNQAVRAERQDLQANFSQRFEVLESRLGVERSDLIARQVELKQVVANGDQNGTVVLQDLARRFRGELDACERRLQAEQLMIRERVDLALEQWQSTRSAEEEARRATIAALSKQLEVTSEHHAEAVRGVHCEIESGLREAMEAIRAESQSRLADESQFLADATEASKVLAMELQAVRSALRQQAEDVSVELERIRRSGTERADLLSRYVDSAIAEAKDAELGTNDRDIHAQLFSISERLAGQRVSCEERWKAVESRLDTLAEDVTQRIRRSDDAREREITALRKITETERLASERRGSAVQEELRGRFESFVRHFEDSIASLQDAILLPNGLERRSCESSADLANNSPRREASASTADYVNYPRRFQSGVFSLPENPQLADSPALGSHAFVASPARKRGISSTSDCASDSVVEIPPLPPIHGKQHQQYRQPRPSTDSGARTPLTHEPVPYRVLVRGLRVFDAPHLRAQVVGVLPEGCRVEIEGFVKCAEHRCWGIIGRPFDGFDICGCYVLEETDTGKLLIEPCDAELRSAKLAQSAAKVSSLQLLSQTDESLASSVLSSVAFSGVPTSTLSSPPASCRNCDPAEVAKGTLEANVSRSTPLV